LSFKGRMQKLYAQPRPAKRLLSQSGVYRL
jgi:hypothetical protein